MVVSTHRATAHGEGMVYAAWNGRGHLPALSFGGLGNQT